MHASDERETKKIAEKIAKSIKNRNITICLNGDLGAGKTTFTRFLINSLQNKKKNDEIPSPTFTLLQTYEYDYGLIHHYDFYRLDRVQELIELNFSESLNDNISGLRKIALSSKFIFASRQINFSDFVIIRGLISIKLASFFIIISYRYLISLVAVIFCFSFNYIYCVTRFFFD